VSYRLYRLGRAVANFFFPQFCIGCGREGDVICPVCLGKLPRLLPPYCSRCGLPQDGSRPCRDCANLDTAIDGIRSPFTFEKLAREVVHQFKYQNLRVLAAPLSVVLYAYLSENRISADMLIPVPLHPKRLRERGYNQSLLLAFELGKLSGIPVRPDILKRRINTPSQARTASSIERHRNMHEAFTSVDGKVKDKRILLIDDVSTSGATLDACASALKQAGAISVWGLTVAREV